MSFIESSNCEALYGDLRREAAEALAKRQNTDTKAQEDWNAAGRAVNEAEKQLEGQIGYRYILAKDKLDEAVREEARTKDVWEAAKYEDALELEEYCRIMDGLTSRHDKRMSEAAQECLAYWVEINRILLAAGEEDQYCREALADLTNSQAGYSSGRIDAVKELSSPNFLNAQDKRLTWSTNLYSVVADWINHANAGNPAAKIQKKQLKKKEPAAEPKAKRSRRQGISIFK